MVEHHLDMVAVISSNLVSPTKHASADGAVPGLLIQVMRVRILPGVPHINTMNDNQDITAAKLRGCNIMIRFIDGEALFVKLDEDDNDFDDFFIACDEFLKNDGKYFPLPSISVQASSIKYIKKI